MKFPALFLGHGSPMNAIMDNAFTKFLVNLGRELGKPEAIAVISAHWQTLGTCISCQTQPKQIYDFYGFPKELYDVKYTPHGATDIANELINNSDCMITCNDFWGLDHAAWVLLKHMYPKADVPVFEISLDKNKRPREHFDTGKKLRFLRENNILVIGSGNVVHNLSAISPGIFDPVFPWAKEFNELIKEKISTQNFDQIIDYYLLGQSSNMSVPTEEHYLPLLYILGIMDEKESAGILFDEIQHGSISMLSIKVGD